MPPWADSIGRHYQHCSLREPAVRGQKSESLDFKLRTGHCSHRTLIYKSRAVSAVSAFRSQGSEPQALEFISHVPGFWNSGPPVLGELPPPSMPFIHIEEKNPQLFVMKISANGFWRTDLFIFNESIKLCSVIKRFHVFNDFYPVLLQCLYSLCPQAVLAPCLSPKWKCSKFRRQDDLSSEVAYVTRKNAFSFITTSDLWLWVWFLILLCYRCDMCSLEIILWVLNWFSPTLGYEYDTVLWLDIINELKLPVSHMSQKTSAWLTPYSIGCC